MDSETINFCKPEQVRAIHPYVGGDLICVEMNASWSNLISVNNGSNGY